MTDLLTFPENSETLRDSGEGGQYVLLVVPEVADPTHNCCVDVNVVLTLPDVCLSRTDLWHEHDDRVRIGGGDAYQYFRSRAEDAAGVIQDVKTDPVWFKRYRDGKPNYKDLASWAIRTLDPGYLSRGVQLAAFLGSSSLSLWSEARGAYWSATPADLTPVGRQLYDAITASYEVEPLLLTFLDT